MSLPESPRPLRMLFCMTGPNELNGPNVWLTRHLPRLRARGADAQLLYATFRPDLPCSFRDQIAAAGVPVHNVALDRYTEDVVRGLCAVIDDVRPEIFCPNCFLFGYYAARFARETGVSTVGVLHSDDPFYHDMVDVFVAGDPAWRLSGLASVSQFLSGWMDGCCPPEMARIYAPCGVPLPKKTAAPAEGRFRLIYSGRLVERQKRIGRVLDRIEATLRTLPDVEATVYGSGTDRDRVVATIAAADCEGRFRFGGMIDVDQVIPTMCAAHALVLLSDFEGLSIALLEAMACGVVPIVARTRSGTDDVLRDGENALVVEAWHQQGFIDAVRRLRDDRALWQRLSHAAHKTVVELGLTSDACADRWMTLAANLRSGRSRPGQVIVPPLEELPLPTLPDRSDGMRRVDRRSPYEFVRRRKADQRPAYLWGAGGAGRAFLPILRRAGVNVRGFVDSNPEKHGTVVEGLLVVSPDVLVAHGLSESPPFVFITSMFVTEIIARLESLGLKNVVDFAKT